MASTSQAVENAKMTEGRFSEEHFTPILSSDEEEYDDYTEKDVEEFPELDFTDEQLKEAVSKLSRSDYEQCVQLRDQYLMHYRVTGRIQTFSDLVEVPIKHSKKDQGVEKLTPFVAQTIKECIDISAEPDESLLIKVRQNVPLHQALTEDELDLQAFFGEEDSDAASEYSLNSEEEEDPFTPAAAKNLLYSLAERNKQHAKLQEEAAKLLGKGGIPQEAAEEVFKQALGGKRKSTAISEELYDNCIDETEFHMIMCCGVRVMDEARAWRMRQKLKPKKGEFKDLNPRSFKDLAVQFGLAPTTINRNYNEVS